MIIQRHNVWLKLYHPQQVFRQKKTFFWQLVKLPARLTIEIMTQCYAFPCSPSPFEYRTIAYALMNNKQGSGVFINSNCMLHNDSSMPYFSHGSHFTYWPFRPKGYCRCMRLPVCPSVRKLYIVRAITCHRFGLESPNLNQTCTLGYARLVLKLGVIDPILQGHSCSFDSEL